MLHFPHGWKQPIKQRDITWLTVVTLVTTNLYFRRATSSLLPSHNTTLQSTEISVPCSQPSPVSHVRFISTSDDNTGSQLWEIEQFHELSKCRQFVNNICGCKTSDDKPCSGLFSLEWYIESRAQSSFLTHEQLDLVLIGLVLSTVNASDKGVGRHQTKQLRITVTFISFNTISLETYREG